MGWRDGMVEVGALVGKTLVSVRQGTGGPDEWREGDTLTFTADDGSVFCMYHEQDCCEGVSIEDIAGDLQDLVGSPIVRAEERSGGIGDNEAEYPAKTSEWGGADESWTWTLYELATNKGSVTIRWYGASNGYYSEAVTLARLSAPSDAAAVA